MEVQRFKKICIEIYKTVNDLNPTHMKYVFKKPTNRSSKRLKHNLASAKHYQTNFGTRSLRVFGSQIWNRLPDDIKGAGTLNKFKQLIDKFCWI